MSRTPGALRVVGRAGRHLPQPAKRSFAALANDHPTLYRAKVRYLAGKCDVFLVSFPKCGRTWLRVMLGKVVRDHFALGDRSLLRFTDATVDSARVPKILATHDDSPQVKRPEALIRDKSAYRSRPVVLLVRDPRDAVVSLYFHRTRRRRDSYEGTLSDFVREPVGSLETMVAFYNLWAEQRNVPRDLLLVRYEDLHERPSLQLRRVLDFVGLSAVSDETAARAVEFASFDRMQRRERSAVAGSRAVRAPDAADPDSFKARRGLVGGYVQELRTEDVARVDEKVRELDPFYRYA